jgi:hypothetical protein
MTARAPMRVPLWTVRLAARTLPPVHRVRYEGEFTAELYGMARSAQLRHAAQVLASAWVLRGALSSAPSAPIGAAMSHLPTIPLTCRLNLRHKWRMVSTEDGRTHYWACAICDRAKPDRMSNLKGGIGFP